MNEQDIPIDIHSNKLLDWLISRRHCNKDWHLYILKIREKINNAIQDMPGHDGIVKLLSGSHINYFHCKKIIDILKETEADSKNIFGRYGSQRMKDWQEILQLYERDNIYLAEAAQILIRNINFEVPSLRKQIAKLEQLQSDCIKREKDYTKSENTARQEFVASCKQLGIDGIHVRQELLKLVDELPRIYDEIAEEVKSIEPAIKLYVEFLKFNSGKDGEVKALDLLTYIIENGNTTTYEWTYGEKPSIVLEAPVEIQASTEVAPSGDGIDFGDDSIDWSVDPGQEIDFDISLEESGIVVEENDDIEKNEAQGNDAFTLLDNPRTQNQAIDELAELESFLKMRLFELSSENDLLSISQMQNAPAILQMQTVESVTQMLNLIQIVENKLTNKRTMHLHSIKHFPKYVDRLANELQQKLTIAEKMQASRKVVLERASEARKQIVDIKPTIDLIISKTKILQEEIQQEISKKYKNRTVNIIGGINVL